MIEHLTRNKKSISILSISATLVLILFVLISIRRPSILWDSWAYHLPLSAEIFNINNYKNSFIVAKTLQIRLEGFPFIGEFIQGALWKITGNIKSVALLSSVTFLTIILLVHKLTKANLPILVFGILATPLISYHLTSSYLDLFMSCFIFLQFISAVFITKACEENFSLKSNINLWLLIFLLSTFIAGNTKLWAPIICSSIAIFLIYNIQKEHKKIIGNKMTNKIILFVMISIILGSATLITNCVKFKNPFYPVKVTIPFTPITLNGPEKELDDYPGYLDNSRISSRPLYFLASITEIDWLIRGVPPCYHCDEGAGDVHKRYDRTRTGGFWFLSIFYNFFILVFLVKKMKSENPYLYKKIHFSLSFFCFLTIILSVMPLSHNLRYILYWPMILIFITSHVYSKLHNTKKYGNLIICGYIILFLISLFYLRGESIASLNSYKSESEVINIDKSAKEIEIAKKNKKLCLGREYNPDQFKYSSVFHSGNYIIEQGWLDCEHFTEFKK